MLRNGKYIVFTPFFPSKKSHNGSYIFDQINEIRNQTNFDIRVIKIVSIFSFESDYEYNGFKVNIFKVIDFPSFIFPGSFNYLNKIRILKFIELMNVKDIAILHGHTSYPSAFLLNCISDQFICKTIIQHHGLDVLQLLFGRNSFIRRVQTKYIISRSIKQLNKIDLNIGVSQAVLDSLNVFPNYNPKSELVLYNGVDLSLFFDRNMIKGDFFKIGCIANFLKTKDHMTLIRACELLIISGINIKLELIGSGPTLSSCKSYVKRNNLDSKIFFLKEKPHHEMNDFYNSLNLFVLPSFYEALGCVYMESWATNTPFIGVEGQGISEIVVDPKCMLIKKRDHNDLQNKILFFVNNSIQFKFDNSFSLKQTIGAFLNFDIFK